jgi:small subunit ribosomal protein S21
MQVEVGRSYNWARLARRKRCSGGVGYTRNTSDYGILEAHLAEVRSQQGESIENLLRRFKRKVQTEDIIKDVKRHSYYLKPGEKKRVKQALARKRARKKSRTSTD